MEARAMARSVGMSPRKMRMVVDLIRGRGVNEAYSILKFSKKAATTPIEKEGSFVDVDDLVVKEAYVNEGRTLKGFSPRAMGRATPILKRTSHVVIVVDRADHKE
jgi:large subunit ribosomal protein L22